MELFALLAVLLGSAFMFVKIACRRRISKGREPSFLLAVAGALFAGLLMVFIFYGPALFTRRFWNDNMVPMVIVVPIVFGVCTLVSLLPAWLVVRHYRKGFKDESHLTHLR